MMMIRKLGFLCALSATLLLNGQNTTANISGTVSDTSGAAMASATVQVKNVGTGVTQSAATDSQGRFSVRDLPVGEYDVQAAAPGFQTVVHKGIILTVGGNSVVDFSLQVGQQQQTVTVQGEVSQVDTSSSQVANLVDPTQMRDIPLNGRNFEQLILLAPGVQVYNSPTSSFYGRNTSYSVAGARPEGQSEILDDTDVQTYFAHGTGAGVLGTSLGIEAIGEFQTLTNTYSAQYGGNGAVVNAVTRSGTNSFHGSAYDFLRNSALDARRFIDPASPPPFRKNQFGGSFGGPIKHDRMFFFVNYEGIRQLLGESALLQVPTAQTRQGILPGVAPINIPPAVQAVLALYPLPNGSIIPNSGLGFYTSVANQIGHEDFVVARYDWAISSKDSLFVRYLRDHADLTEPFATANTLPLWPEQDVSHNQFATIEERRVITPSLINLLRFAYSRPVQNSVTINSTPPLQFFPGSGREDGYVTIPGGMAGAGANTLLPFNIVPNKFTEGDDVYWTHGAHNIRFGVSVERLQTNINPPFQIGGAWSFNSLALFLQGTAQTVTGPLLGHEDAYRAFREIDVWPYFQDDWKVSRKLTVNLGLRYEFATNPIDERNVLYAITNPSTTTASGINAFTHVPHVFASNPSWKNFDPRVGFAYDPFEDHKTSIRAGFGIFHNLITPRSYASSYYIEPPYIPATQTFPTFPYPFLGGGAPSTPQVTVGFDYNVHTTPYVIQYNMNLQHEFRGGFVTTVAYVGSHSVHQFVPVDQNHYQASIDTSGVYHFVQPVAGSNPNPRLNPTLGALSLAEPIGNTEYNSFQAGVSRRFTGSWQAQASYTHSVCLDYGSGSYGLEGGTALENPLNAKFDRGPCNFDVRNNFIANSVYALPFKGNRLVSGWQLSGIWSMHSGSPFSPTDGVNITLNTTGVRPNLNPGCPSDTTIGTVAHWFNAGCYSLQAPGTIGNAGRNTIFGPDFRNLDMALLKDTKLTERVSLQFRAEFFNLANHSNYRNPSGAVFTGSGTNYTLVPTYGLITGIYNTPRQIQFALKILF
jgi:outer membrane receptor protein involved in Fe transport